MTVTDPRSAAAGGDPAAPAALTSRRRALAHLDHVRELVASYLEHPSNEGFRAMTSDVRRFLRFEVDDVFSEVARGGFPAEVVEGLAQGHCDLITRVNRLAWHVPGSAELHLEAHDLRRELLHQIERYTRLRLPRGAVVTGPERSAPGHDAGASTPSSSPRTRVR